MQEQARRAAKCRLNVKKEAEKKAEREIQSWWAAPLAFMLSFVNAGHADNLGPVKASLSIRPRPDGPKAAKARAQVGSAALRYAS